jgi:IS5 family transposase
MLTCKSPWTVMRLAHVAARDVLPNYASRFSRHNYTLAQLFACLVVREFLGLSFRGIEELLRDTQWCQQLGMRSVPDHSTLCRAFRLVAARDHLRGLLDRVTGWMRRQRRLGRMLAVDSTHFDTHHHSRHYEYRLRRYAANTPGYADWKRSQRVKLTPKLGIGIDVGSHFILSVKTKTGMGSDAPDFSDLLYDAWQRHRIRAVLADAGYDSEENHHFARAQLKVRSLIPATIGRPSRPGVAPKGRFRALMRRQLGGTQAGRPFGQRSQVETVMSMLKRNLGDSLRARTIEGRKKELMLKVLTHNLMIRRQYRGSQQSRS